MFSLPWWKGCEQVQIQTRSGYESAMFHCDFFALSCSEDDPSFWGFGVRCCREMQETEVVWRRMRHEASASPCWVESLLNRANQDQVSGTAPQSGWRALLGEKLNFASQWKVSLSSHAKVYRATRASHGFSPSLSDGIGPYTH